MTSAQRQAVLNRHRAGESYQQLADAFGVSRNTIREICKKADGTWKRVRPTDRDTRWMKNKK